MLDMNRLQVLREVARTGSFSAAARALHITPSAVSQQIAALERSAGVDVVDRSPRGVRVTEPGRLLTEATDDLLAGLTQAERRLASYAIGGLGRLAIGTFPSAGQQLLPKALTPITGRPDIEVTVADAEPERSIPMLRAGEIDLALVYHFFAAEPPPEWQDLHYTPLLAEPISVVVPSWHELAGKDRVPVHVLHGNSWIRGVGVCGDQLERMLQNEGVRLRPACRSADYGFVKTLVAGGVGIGLLPSLAVPPHVEGTALVGLEKAPKRYVGVLRRQGDRSPPLVDELVQLLAETGRELPDVVPLGS